MNLIDENTAKDCLKAIECCAALDGHCQFCPYKEIKYPACVEKVLEQALAHIQIHIPMKVHVESWSPNKCPNCGKEIDEHMGDGYYSHPEYDHCPYCLQRLCYLA